MKPFAKLLPLLILLAACKPQDPAPAATSTTEFERLQARAERVEIIRDDFGIPHIYAATDADAVFGML